MIASWRLIAPGRRYLPPPVPDDPVVRQLRELAARDRADERNPGDWSGEERERWLDGVRAQRALMAYYEPVRWPERLLAPPAWRDEVILIAVTTLIAAVGEHAPDTWRLALAVTPLWHIEERLDTRARRRSAARRGLTPETMPRRATVSGALFYVTATLGPWTWRKLRQKPASASPSWTFALAIRIIVALNERRSWRHACRR
jgi:hypothetical protein